MIIESIKNVLLEFKINKLRTFLTMLGIIVGIFSITIIFTLTNSTKVYFNNTISNMFKESVTFYMECSNIEASLIEKEIKEYAENSKKINMLAKSTSFEYPEYDKILDESSVNNYFSGTYLAIDENYFTLNFPNLSKENLVEGRFLTKKDIVSKCLIF